MANIGGLSSGSSTNLYGAKMKGYGGLASGMDTDSMIEGMTLGTRTKIQEALKKKTKYQWQTDAYRSITDKLIGFSKKYLDIGSLNSPYRAGFFDKSLVTAHGTNSKFLSVTGTSNALENMSVLGIKQLARDSSLVTNHNSSGQVMSTGNINFGEATVSKLDEGQLKLNYDGVGYTLNFSQGAKIAVKDASGNYQEQTLDFTSPASTKQSIDWMLQSVNVVDRTGTPTGDKLSDKISFDVEANGYFSLSHKDPTDATQFAIGGGSEEALKALGFMDSDNKLVGNGLIVTGGKLEGESPAADVSYKRQFDKFMAGKQITFSYNGVSKSIKMPDDETSAVFDNVDNFKDYLQTELNAAFGSGKITVARTDPSDPNNTSLSFATNDPSSLFKITDADTDIMGKKGVMSMSYANTNRLNREESLINSGLAGLPAGFGEYDINPATGEKIYRQGNGLDKLYNEKGELKLTVNGKPITGLTVESSLYDITNAINSSNAGVKVTYVETADRFSIQATAKGEAGKIEFNDGGDGGPSDFLKTLFGAGSGNTPPAIGTDFERVKGQDAIMTVKYEGNMEMDIKRDSNSFNLDGSTFNLNTVFGYKEKLDTNGNPIRNPITGLIEYDKIPGTEEITFTAAVDTEKVSKVIKEMIDDYNTVLEETFKQVSTKPDRNYGPLTDDEKSQLNSEDIKKLEDKAKEGILFNDGLLRSLSDQLRSVFSGVTDAGTLKNMGINLSSDYAANGKITFDEEAFKSALLENPDEIKNLFTKPIVKDARGDVIDSGGFSVRLKSITDSFAKWQGTPKGTLIEKAGSTLSPTSVLQNSLKKLMDGLDDQVDVLKDRLQVEIDRYTRQFSTLEQLVQQMNAQSGWLTQALGG